MASSKSSLHLAAARDSPSCRSTPEAPRRLQRSHDFFPVFLPPWLPPPSPRLRSQVFHLFQWCHDRSERHHDLFLSVARAQSRPESTAAAPCRSTSSSLKASAHIPNCLLKRGLTHPPLYSDNLINQKVLTRQLKLAGYTVSVANNGREGLDLLLAESELCCYSQRTLAHVHHSPVAETRDPNPSPIVCALMDIEMPVMGGLEAIRLLREMESTGEVDRHYVSLGVLDFSRLSLMMEGKNVAYWLPSFFTFLSPRSFSFVLLRPACHCRDRFVAHLAQGRQLAKLSILAGNARQGQLDTCIQAS